MLIVIKILFVVFVSLSWLQFHSIKNVKSTTITSCYYHYCAKYQDDIVIVFVLFSSTECREQVILKIVQYHYITAACINF